MAKGAFRVTFFDLAFPHDKFAIESKLIQLLIPKNTFMRLLFLFVLATSLLGANAQQISGIAKDAEGKPVSGATISLLRDTGRAVLKFAVTKETGSYTFASIKPGNYRITVSHVAFQPA